jgi:hypothetical protein
MKCKSMAIAPVCVIALLAAIAPAFGQERKAGDHLVYDVKMTGQGGHIGGRANNMSFAITIDSVQPDGSALAKITMPGRGDLGFDATISPAGEILPKYDPNLKPHVPMSDAEAQAFAANQAAQGFSIGVVPPINAFANAVAQRGTLHVGDSWRAEMDVPFSVDSMYTVTGQQNQSGHTVYSIAANATTSQGTMTLQGSYDSTDHLVSALHYDVTNANGQTLTTDFTLHQ